MNNRARALEWWRGLTQDQQNDMVKKYFPDYSFILISTSTYKIEIMWETEIYRNRTIVRQQDIIDSWNEAEELKTSLTTLTDEEIIECKSSLIQRCEKIMSLLDKYVNENDVEK